MSCLLANPSPACPPTLLPSQLWLNEGFAHYCEYVVTNALFPEWRTFEHFTAGTQKAAFSLDAMASTHPIEVPVNDPDEVSIMGMRVLRVECVCL